MLQAPIAVLQVHAQDSVDRWLSSVLPTAGRSPVLLPGVPSKQDEFNGLTFIPSKPSFPSGLLSQLWEAERSDSDFTAGMYGGFWITSNWQWLELLFCSAESDFWFREVRFAAFDRITGRSLPAPRFEYHYPAWIVSLSDVSWPLSSAGMYGSHLLQRPVINRRSTGGEGFTSTMKRSFVKLLTVQEEILSLTSVQQWWLARSGVELRCWLYACLGRKDICKFMLVAPRVETI